MEKRSNLDYMTHISALLTAARRRPHQLDSPYKAGQWWYDPETERTMEVVRVKGNRVFYTRIPDINAPGTQYYMDAASFGSKFTLIREAE